MSIYGTPGPVYVDLPADILLGKFPESQISYYPAIEPIPALVLPQSTIDKTLNLLRQAKSPLVIVGKGVAYANAQDEIRSFVEKSNLPVLASPMGKGIIKDTDKLSVGSARTFVLKNADVIFLCGARLNWILHFGAPPRFNPNVKIIQLDNDPHEIHSNLRTEIPLVGDAKVLLSQLANAVKEPLL
jgi:2-hydroxyacyl-CoA lyase 1